MKNLIDIKSLSNEEITKIIDLAQKFENNRARSNCQNKHLALIFSESSTRTRFSFEMASNKLGVHLYNFEEEHSSVIEGESLEDTIKNLEAIGIDGVVIRHPEAGIVKRLAMSLNSKIKIINGGDGANAHPTQALLDFYTIKNHLKDIEGKKIAIIGDILHSRVAKSNIELLSRFGANLTLCAPEYFQTKKIQGNWTDKLSEALEGADVAMFLRSKKERIEQQVRLEEYIEHYGLTRQELNSFAKPNVLIMHPGPVNRDIEISSDLLDSEICTPILEQAKNGVFVRMAILDLLLSAK